MRGTLLHGFLIEVFTMGHAESLRAIWWSETLLLWLGEIFPSKPFYLFGVCHWGVLLWSPRAALVKMDWGDTLHEGFTNHAK